MLEVAIITPPRFVAFYVISICDIGEKHNDGNKNLSWDNESTIEKKFHLRDKQRIQPEIPSDFLGTKQ